MATKRPRNRNNTSGIRGLYLKKGHFVYQPPMVAGARSPAVHRRTADLGEAMALIEDLAEQGLTRAETEPLTALVTQFLADKLALGEHKSAKTSRSARTASPSSRRRRRRWRSGPRQGLKPSNPTTRPSCPPGRRK